jgi:hypothetical protein
MLLGVEIVAEKSFIINEGNFFACLLIFNNLPQTASLGKDVFDLNGILLKDKRLSALGRTRNYSLHSASATNQLDAAPAQLIDLGMYSPGDSVKIKVNNNIFLDQGLLTHHLGLRLFDQQGKVIEIPLSIPDFPATWFGRGNFYLDISEIVRPFSKPYSCSLI